MTNGSFMKVESIVESSPWSICNTQYALHKAIIGIENQFLSFRVAALDRFYCIIITVNPLYTDTLYNSKILHNAIYTSLD